MLLLHYLRRLYSLDTLDTRFTKYQTPIIDPAKGQENDLVATREPTSNGSSKTLPSGARPSRWATPEYYFYYFVFATVVPFMFKVPYDVSKASDSQYPKFAPLLSDGWIFGRKVDNSDLQYASFRNNIPYMALVVVLHPLSRRLFNFLKPLSTTGVRSQESLANARQSQRVQFDLIFGTLFVFVLHGFSAPKVFAILYTNYLIAKRLPQWYIAPATWAFNIATLFANEYYNGYPYARISQRISGNHLETSGTAGWAAWLDQHGGLIPRWDVLFNITVLRLISFNLDYYWSLDARAGSPVEANSFKKKQLDPSNLSERDRVATPAAADSFTLSNYMSYTLYSPLYLAGPILTFNDYISQLRYPPTSIRASRTLLYAVRFLITLLAMELVLHYIYAVAISKSSPDWTHYTPFQLSMLAYFNLHIIWLKLLLPWRFFRLWSLLDNVDPPENMVRCMSDNYSAQGFWRSWHRSFNRWIIRYIYVPLGGSDRASSRGSSMARNVGNLLVVFTFVALWHDISLRLLTWSWLIILFLLPELLCTTLLFPARNYKNRPNTYRMLSGIGAVGNILMMMAANLVGFALGLDGLEGIVGGIVSGIAGWAFLAAACGALFVGTMVMFEIREGERRKGIVMKC